MLEQENGNLRKELYNAKLVTVSLEQSNRRDNLIMNGIPVIVAKFLAATDR